MHTLSTCLICFYLFHYSLVFSCEIWQFVFSPPRSPRLSPFLFSFYPGSNPRVACWLHLHLSRLFQADVVMFVRLYSSKVEANSYVTSVSALHDVATCRQLAFIFIPVFFFFIILIFFLLLHSFVPSSLLFIFSSNLALNLAYVLFLFL